MPRRLPTGTPPDRRPLRDPIRAALGPRALAVEHVGSTAVPGLAAKPVVDVLVTVADLDDEAGYAGALEAAGFGLRVREPGHRMFRTPERDAHVHVHEPDAPAVDAHLALRDHLRRSAADRELYAAAKRELARREWADVNDHADARSEVIAAILARVRAR